MPACSVLRNRPGGKSGGRGRGRGHSALEADKKEGGRRVRAARPLLRRRRRSSDSRWPPRPAGSSAAGTLDPACRDLPVHGPEPSPASTSRTPAPANSTYEKRCRRSDPTWRTRRRSAAIPSTCRLCTAEVRGSNPLRSTSRSYACEQAFCDSLRAMRTASESLSANSLHTLGATRGGTQRPAAAVDGNGSSDPDATRSTLPVITAQRPVRWPNTARLPPPTAGCLESGDRGRHWGRGPGALAVAASLVFTWTLPQG